MSGSLFAAVVILNSLVAQPGEGADLEKLQGSWVGAAYPIAVTIDGAKGTILARTSPVAPEPIRIEIASVKAGLPNSTLEITATFPEELDVEPWSAPPGRFLVTYRLIDDEIALVLFPIPEGVPASFDPKKMDLAGDAPTDFGTPIRLRRLQPDQVAEFAKLQGAWKLNIPPEKPIGWLDFRGAILTVDSGIATVWTTDNTRQRTAVATARVTLDPKDKRAIVYFYPARAPAGVRSEGFPFGYSVDGADLLTIAYGDGKETLVRCKPEELTPRDPVKEALASLNGAWTVARRWRRTDGRDVLVGGESEETWTFADDEVTVDEGRRKSVYAVQLTGDLTIVRLVSRDDPTKTWRIGRFDAAGGVLRIRLHPTLTPEEPPTPVEKSVSRIRTTLYEFQRVDDRLDR